MFSIPSNWLGYQARGDGIEVFGDTDLLEFWLERVSFE
jgi:hypothetical protein